MKTFLVDLALPHHGRRPGLYDDDLDRRDAGRVLVRTMERRITMIEDKVRPTEREQQINAWLERLLGCTADQLQDHELDAAERYFRALAEDPDGRGEVDVLALRRAVFSAAR